MAVHTYTFPDLVTFTEAARDRSKQTNRALASQHEASVVGRETKWYGLEGTFKGHTVPLADVVKLVNDGWEDGMKRLTAALKAITPPTPMNIRRMPAWGDHGDEVNMDRVRTGNLETAWRFTPKRAVGVAKRNVTIVVDSIASHGIPAEQMFWRGAAAVTLADALTNAGYSVQLLSAFRGDGLHGEAVVCRVMVKDYHAPFDLQTAAACLACPAFFRAIGVAWGFGNLPVGQVHSGAWSVYNALKTADVLDIASGSILHITPQTVSTKEQAQAWVEECVNTMASDEGAMGNE